MKRVYEYVVGFVVIKQMPARNRERCIDSSKLVSQPKQSLHKARHTSRESMEYGVPRLVDLSAEFYDWPTEYCTVPWEPGKCFAKCQ